jgi:F-type H+-transporting ATPase subunit epsilon
MADRFQLTILLPDQILLSTGVSKVGGDAVNGSFVVLPRHIDYVTALVPSILYYFEEAESPSYVAIDRGILVKQNRTVWVSVLQAIPGDNLEHLDQVVEQEFRQLNEQQKQTQTTLTKLELSFMRGLVDLGRSSRGF